MESDTSARQQSLPSTCNQYVFGGCIATPETLKNCIQLQYRINPSYEGWLYAFERDTGSSDSVIIMACSQ
eukprot:1149271-Pelagomonas_calceolata.AAC.2